MNNASETSLSVSFFIETILSFWWIILPITFYYIFKILWIDYVAVFSPVSWAKSQKWMVLEIIPPADIEKSPKIMENIFTGLAGVHTTYNTFDEYLKGAFWHDRFSFELIGEEGKVHFYVRTQIKNRNFVEAQVYAQYPDAEIVEVPDYTMGFPKIIPNRDWDLWGADFEFNNADAIPIKTYDKFEESVTGEIIDPLASMTELIGTSGPGQYIWLQYVIQILPEGDKKKYEGVLKKLKGEKEVAPMNALGHLKDVFSNLWKGLWSPVEFAKSEKKDEAPLEFRLTPVEKEVLKATEENLGKNLYKTKMRYIYVARKKNFDSSYKGAFVGCIKLFNDLNYNQVKPNDITKTYGKIFFKEGRSDFRKRKLYKRYTDRSMDGPTVVFSTKELATLYHFPAESVKSPSLTRVGSKLGSPPPNLPIG